MIGSLTTRSCPSCGARSLRTGWRCAACRKSARAALIAERKQMQHPAYRRRIAALAEARAELESSVVDGDSPYAIAYRELVVEYGAALVAKAMYVVDHEHDPRRIAEIARKHYEKMAYLAGIDQINERFGASSTKAGRAA